MIAALRDAVDHTELLQNLTLRELRTRYRRSLLGWGWSLVNPVVITACYTFVFNIVLQVHPEAGNPSGNNIFAFFLLAGLLPWNFFAAAITSSMASVLGSHGLIAKVYFPRELLVFSTVISLIVTLLIEVSVVMALLVVFGYFALHLIPILLIIVILQTLFATGLALLLSALSVRSRDIPYLTGIGLTVWFFLTPIVYSFSHIPERKTLLGLDLPLRNLLLLNPMARFIEAYRNVLWDIRVPPLRAMLVLAAISVVTFAIGYQFFIRRARYFAEEL